MRSSHSEAKGRFAYASFFLMFFFFYMTDAASGYLMIFLKGIGYNTLQMGLLTTAASLVALAVQPIMGMVADRAPTRNGVLMAALAIAAILMPLLRLSQAFAYILVLYTLFTIVRNMQHPLTDAITLTYTAQHGYAFGPIRTMGCLGYAVMSYIAGTVADTNPANTFFLYAASSLLTLGVVLLMPPSSGSHAGKRTANPFMLLRNPTLLTYTLLAMMFSVTKTFYHQFFSVYFTSELGGNASLYGTLLSVGALIEIPTIFFLDRLIKRFGAKRVMLLAGLFETLRWLLTALVTNPYAQLGVQAVFGLSNMVLSITVMMFVSRVLPQESKASGQATYTMITRVGATLLGSLVGGTLSKAMGIRPVFYLCVLVNALALALFYWRGHNEPMPEAETTGT